MRAATIDLLQGAIADPDTNGARHFRRHAEFSRDRDRSRCGRPTTPSAVTPRGGTSSASSA
jgi:hypothetical protein